MNSQGAPRPSPFDLGALLDQPLPQPARLGRKVVLAPAGGELAGEGDDVAPEADHDGEGEEGDERDRRYHASGPRTGAQGCILVQSAIHPDLGLRLH